MKIYEAVDLFPSGHGAVGRSHVKNLLDKDVDLSVRTQQMGWNTNGEIIGDHPFTDSRFKNSVITSDRLNEEYLIESEEEVAQRSDDFTSFLGTNETCRSHDCIIRDFDGKEDIWHTIGGMEFSTMAPKRDPEITTVIETDYNLDHVPHQWITWAKDVDEVWVPNQWVYDAFESAGYTDNIEVVPYGCFTADTNVAINGDNVDSIDGDAEVLDTHKYELRDPMIKLETQNRELKATRNHEILVRTNNGDEWKKSINVEKGDEIAVINDTNYDTKNIKEIVDNYEQSEPNVDRRRAPNSSRNVSDRKSVGYTRETSQQNVECNSSKSQQNRSFERSREPRLLYKEGYSRANKLRVGLCGWNNRWGRNYNHKNEFQRKHEPPYNNYQLQQRLTEVFEGPSSRELLGKERKQRFINKTLLQMGSSGQLRLYDSRECRTDANRHKRASKYTPSDKRNSDAEVCRSKSWGKGTESNKENKRVEYEVVTEKSNYIPEEGTVYDLTTSTSNYTANGVVVHNCDFSYKPTDYDCTSCRGKHTGQHRGSECLDDDTFTFFSVMRWYHIKGVDVLLEAFLREFSGDEDVRLFLKTTSNNRFDMGGIGKLVQQFANQLGITNPPEVGIRTEMMNDQQLMDLYGLADAFAFPSRAECVGISPMQAAHAGTPVVTNNWSSLGLYFDDDEAILIDDGDVKHPEPRVDWVPIKTGEWYPDEANWFEPDIQAVQDGLREAFEMDEAERDALGKRGQEMVHETFDWDTHIETRLDRFEQLEK